MDPPRQRNELTPVGNVRAHARGDELGPVVRSRNVKKSKRLLRRKRSQQSLKLPPHSKQEAQPETAVEVEQPKAKTSVKAKAGKTKAETAEEDWVEDADGNFVKRGA